MRMEHRLLNQNFKVKIWLRSNLATISFFYLGLIDKVQYDLQILVDPKTWLKNSDNLGIYNNLNKNEINYKPNKRNLLKFQDQNQNNKTARILMK